jgi:hypothetical protein
MPAAHEFWQDGQDLTIVGAGKSVKSCEKMRKIWKKCEKCMRNCEK